MKKKDTNADKPARNVRGKKVHLPLSELKNQLTVSVTEAMRISGFSRAKINKLMDGREVRWFTEGCRARIVTASLTEYATKRAEEVAA